MLAIPAGKLTTMTVPSVPENTLSMRKGRTAKLLTTGFGLIPADKEPPIMRDTPNRAIYLYLRLTFAFSAVVWILIIWSGHLAMGFGLVIPALMWCPALAALVTCRRLGRNFLSLAWRWPNNTYIVAAYLVPLAYTSLAYGAVWMLGLAGWNSEYVGSLAQSLGLKGLPAWASFTLGIIFMATGGVIENLATTLGEEIGWRGLLLPELAKQMSFTKASLVSGIVWTAWHSPLLIFADYNVGTNRWYALACTTVMCVSVSFILAWLRLKANSLWPAALLHASHNLFIPIVFDNLTRNTGPTLWYTTVFGAALASTTAVFALYFWKRRTEIQQIATGNLSGRDEDHHFSSFSFTRSRLASSRSPRRFPGE